MRLALNQSEHGKQLALQVIDIERKKKKKKCNNCGDIFSFSFLSASDGRVFVLVGSSGSAQKSHLSLFHISVFAQSSCQILARLLSIILQIHLV